MRRITLILIHSGQATEYAIHVIVALKMVFISKSLPRKALNVVFIKNHTFLKNSFKYLLTI
jgi:hypothetical protein